MTEDVYLAEQKEPFAMIGANWDRSNHLNDRLLRRLSSAIGRSQQSLCRPLTENLFQAPTARDWQEYLQDAGQRTVLFMDVLRQRGDNTLAHKQKRHPLLISFDYEVLIDGKNLSQPVNCSLLRIIPQPDQAVEESRQPVLVVDPRSGYGAGISGLKSDSIIGESVRTGRPTYFITFEHEPVPRQTLDQIKTAQMHFIEAVTQRHPEAANPVVIGNSQAGEALMRLAASRPALPGLIIVNAAPLSARPGSSASVTDAGRMLGSAGMTRLAGDLGNGRIDGAWLVSGSDMLDPAEAVWAKYYRVFRDVDIEQSTFLDVERWWGNPSFLTPEEIEEMVAGQKTDSAKPLDLSHITAPVVIFCSDGDTITPPAQALNWINETYPSDQALREAGRTIVYLKHRSIGHLDMFLSEDVARREHRALLSAIDNIQNLCAGLFELIIEDAPENPVGHAVRFEPRLIADIASESARALDDEPQTDLIDQTSEAANLGYDTYVRPWIRQWVKEPIADAIRTSHPFHQQQLAWNSLNPLLWWLPATAEQVRANRQAVRESNPLLAWQDVFSQQTRDVIDTCCEVRDAATEYWFNSLYASLNPLAKQPSPDSREQDINVADQASEARAEQPVTNTPPPSSEAETAPEQTVTEPAEPTKPAPAKRTVKSKASPGKRSPTPTTTPRKPAKKSGNSTSAEAAKQAIATPPLPLKMPKAGSAATLHTEAAPITQLKSDSDGAPAPTSKSDKDPDSQS